MKYQCNAAWRYVPIFGTLWDDEEIFAEEDLDLGAMIHSRKKHALFRLNVSKKNIRVSLNGLLNVSSRVK